MKGMKPLQIIPLCLLVIATRALAQDPAPDPKAGELVKCGSEKVAIFGGTESKDGHYALAWTIRPDRKKTPVDWSSYDRNDTNAFFGQYSTSDGEHDDYAVVDGLLDLEARKFWPLPTKYPFHANEGRRGLGVLWSEEKHGVRHALIDLDNDWSSFTLLLAEVGSGGAHYLDVRESANHAVSGFLRRQVPHTYKQYVVGYAGYAQQGSTLGTDPIKVDFDAQVPKMENPEYTGVVTMTLAGKVTGVTGKKGTP